MRDKELHQHCKQFIQSSLEIIHKTLRHSKISIPSKDMLKAEFKKDGSGYRTGTEKVPDFYLFIFMIEEIGNSQAHNSLTQYLLNNKNIRNLYTEYEITRSLSTSFLAKYLEKSPKMTFEEELFNSVYQSFEEYLFCSSVQYRIYAVVSRLEIDTKKLSLEKNLNMINISENDFSKILNFYSYPSMSSGFPGFLSPKTAILERTFKVRKNPEVVMNTPTSEQYTKTIFLFNNVLTTLRLFKAGAVGFNTVFYENLSEWEHGMSARSSTFKPPISGEGYRLVQSEENALKKLWGEMKGIDFAERKSVGLAMRRFGYAYERRLNEDKIIDFMIAFESLFLRGRGAPTKKGQFIALGCSMLIGKNDKEREKITDFLVKAYDKRNKIVHGSGVKVKPQLISRIEGYLREAIKELLLNQE